MWFLPWLLVLLLAGIAGSTPTNSVQPPATSAPGGTAGEGSPAVPAPPAVDPADGLPFELPDQEVLTSSDKKVFAHYFTPYPVSIDNLDATVDYYTRSYLNPLGEGGKHWLYGGFLRDRPLPRPVDASADWALHDMQTEVRRASAAGLDGFTVDVLTLDGYNWERLKRLLTAASSVEGFSITLMPDGTASSVGGGYEQLATSLAGLANDPTYGDSLSRLDDGRLVVSPFAPDLQSPEYWQGFMTAMAAKGVPVALVPCLLDYWANAARFAPFSYGLSNWGGRSPAANQDLAAFSADAHSRGVLWMQPVSMQDARPYAGVYDEANNSENLRTTWEGAIEGADWVQLATWNDYSEGTQFAPSAHVGWGPLDLSSYYLVRFKTGSFPRLTGDALYVSHRIQAVAARPTGSQSLLMALRPGSSPSRDAVEVLTFLTAEADVTVDIGATTHVYHAPAGFSVQTFPLATGTVAASAARAGSVVAQVTSPFPVVAAPVVQDLTYHFASSNR